MLNQTKTNIKNNITNMRRLLKQILILVCLVSILIIPYFVFAESSLEKLRNVGEKSGFDPATNEYTMARIAGTAVNAFLSLLGIIFVILMLTAGYNWMTASGDEEKITKAKNTIWRAIIGLLITIGAYAIWSFIFDSI